VDPAASTPHLIAHLAQQLFLAHPDAKVASEALEFLEEDRPLSR
jgi:hypothetical protein